MSAQSTHPRNESRELAKKGAGGAITRRQMIAGAALGLAALALPTPLLDLVPGAKPREAMATGQAYIENNRYFVILADENQAYCLVAWSGSTASYMRVGTYPLDKAGIDKFWLAENIFAHKYKLKNFCTGTYLDRSGNGYEDGTPVGVWEGNGSAAQGWWVDQNNDGSVAIVGAQKTGTGNGDGDVRCLDTNGLGSDCILWYQEAESGAMGSKNVRQRWWLRYADYYFDVNPDDNKYGVSYSKGARVKSFDLKARCGSKQTYQATGLDDYYRRDLYGAVYELTNVTYRTGYRYKNCVLNKGTLRASADDGTSFTVKHDVWGDIALSINTEPIPFNLDVTFDGDKYGKTYSLGAHVKSFSVKVTLDGTVTYNESNLEDYDRQDGFNCTYEITNVVYRDEYVYAGCTLSAGTLVSQADDGTSFTIQHTAAEDITFDIQTKAAIIYPKGPTKSVKITS